MTAATTPNHQPRQVELPPLLTWQQQVAEQTARFRVAACGRRAGKTQLGTLLCLRAALLGGTAWWVAPTYQIALIGWRTLRRVAVQVPGTQVREAEYTLLLPTGGRVQVRSASDPDSLRGESLNFVVVDEAAFVREEAWTEALRPALADRQGRALFCSTPKGRNWFWRLFQSGVDPHESEWRAWQLPTAINPLIAPEEIEAARRSLPERVFAQEFLAQFQDQSGGVFRRVMDAATATEQLTPVAGHAYLFGVDWGRTNDFTAIAVLDATTRELVALDRFNQIDYATQTTRLRALYERFKPDAIVAERNSLGDPLVEQLRREGLPVRPFLTSNASKAEAVDALTLAFERSAIRVVPDPVLIGELQAYEATRLPSGLMRYSAPDGMHDDTVMALALAWHGLAAPTPQIRALGSGCR